jgi:hypothetical protein
MPPRYAYWTILAGGLPTAFRAAERDDLLPTFKRIQDKHPDAQMKYFARGQIWDSPEAARAAKEQPPRSARLDEAAKRGREWRPGGEHRDPRQPFKDAKKARNQDRRKQRFERKNRPAARERPARQDRPDWRSKDRAPRGNRPDWRSKDRPPREKPHGDPFRRPARPRPFARNQGPEDPRPPRPDREPQPDREPRPDRERPRRDPRPKEPTAPPSAPPERGRPFTPRSRFQSSRPKGPKRRP